MSYNPPRMPKWTCPIIDRVQYSIEMAQKHIDDVIGGESISDYSDACFATRSELNGLKDEMEEIRTANSQLRACAEYWEALCEDLTKQLDDLTDQISDVRSELSEAMSDNEAMRRELNEQVG